MGGIAFAPPVDTNPTQTSQNGRAFDAKLASRAWCCPDVRAGARRGAEHMHSNREAATARNHCDAAATVVPRYDALVRVSEALRAYRDRDSLFSSLARELRPVLGFSFLSIGLYDPRTHTVDRFRTRSDRRAARAATT